MRNVSRVVCMKRARDTHKVVGEGRELLDPADGNVLDTLLLTLLEQRVVHLACGLWQNLSLSSRYA